MSRGEAGGRSLEAMLRRPAQVEKLAPCQAACPAGGDVRGWIQTVVHHRSLGLDFDEARRRAWTLIAEVNPLPACTGRICPHPCESECNRAGKEGAVAVHELERHLGDWAIERGLPLPPASPAPRSESVAVVGSGPAGLSFAYQMARRGYRVVIHESEGRPGGMLLRGVPSYRLPEEILGAEIDRILALGVELRLSSRVGGGIALQSLREQHAAVFLGIGAQVGRGLGVPGEEGPGCFVGTAYLRAVNAGAPPALGERVVVVGGGNTAIDAARCARRSGAAVVLAYRRTREEMPARPEEVEEALDEGVRLLELVAPLEVLRGRDGLPRALRVTTMRLERADGSERGRPVAVAGTERELPVESVIAAISQEPDWRGLEVPAVGGWAVADPLGRVEAGLWTGGDDRGPGTASRAIAQGRLAAEAVHARLRGLPEPGPLGPRRSGEPQLRSSLYPARERVRPARRSPQERLADGGAPVSETIGSEQFLDEAARCLSCGSCFGCERCAVFCNAGGFTRLDEVAPGAWFGLDLGRCEGCGKCIEVCPCGYLEAR